MKVELHLISPEQMDLFAEFLRNAAQRERDLFAERMKIQQEQMDKLCEAGLGAIQGAGTVGPFPNLAKSKQ